MIQVAKLTYDLHTADGLAAFQQWLQDNGVTVSNCVKIHITEDERRQIVVWDTAGQG